MYQDPSKTWTKNIVFEKFLVVVGGWVVSVSGIIASALVLLRQ